MRKASNTYKSWSKKPLTNFVKRAHNLSKEDLSDYNRGFLESLIQYYKNYAYLSNAQIEAFERMESRFSPAEKVKLEAWRGEYASKYQKDAKILATYYRNTSYFKSMSDNILDNPGYLPAKSSFMKMFNNRYAQQVLKKTREDAKFSVNDMVQVRTKVSSAPYSEMAHRLCIVLENDLPIVSSVIGCKRYRLLPLGASKAIILEERDLMKPNKRGKTN